MMIGCCEKQWQASHTDSHQKKENYYRYTALHTSTVHPISSQSHIVQSADSAALYVYLSGS